MKYLNRIISAMVLGALSAVNAFAAQPVITHKLQPETLHYKVMFKWGLINKQAGTATLTLKTGTDGYTAQLTAASAPWADKIYCVRDTLNGRMSASGFKPLSYEKIANEGNERKHDVVIYDYSKPGIVGADCTRKVFKKGELKVDEKRSLAAENSAVDMLTSFYYMRSLPFEKWAAGHKTLIDIFSGKRKELLTITYHGIVKVDLDGSSAQAYHISFTFTSDDGKKTSDDMDAWISTDDARLPLRLEGKLPVGKVHCIYVP